MTTIRLLATVCLAATLGACFPQRDSMTIPDREVATPVPAGTYLVHVAKGSGLERQGEGVPVALSADGTYTWYGYDLLTGKRNGRAAVQSARMTALAGDYFLVQGNLVDGKKSADRALLYSVVRIQGGSIDIYGLGLNRLVGAEIARRFGYAGGAAPSIERLPDHYGLMKTMLATVMTEQGQRLRPQTRLVLATGAEIGAAAPGAGAAAPSGEIARLVERANRGDANAQFSLGLRYDKGNGVGRDRQAAMDWYRKAAEQGHPSAQVNLGYLIEHPPAGKGDPAEASRWYRRAAESGDARAQFNIGNLYRKGEGLPRNDAEAAAWYRKAADQGHASAQLNLGYLYSSGLGVAKDDALAVAWYRKAAAQGNVLARFNLGLKYRRGEGVAMNLVEATRLFRLAADAGHAKARTELNRTCRQQWTAHCKRAVK